MILRSKIIFVIVNVYVDTLDHTHTLYHNVKPVKLLHVVINAKVMRLNASTNNALNICIEFNTKCLQTMLSNGTSQVLLKYNRLCSN